MLGTAFVIAPPIDLPHTTVMLTAKHTFLPWMFVDQTEKVKIPEEYRKIRYVVGKVYDPLTLGTKELVSEEVRVVSTHPTLDAALLVVRSSRVLNFNSADRLQLNYGTVEARSAEIVGFRGEGVLGEMDTLNSRLLEKLPAEERNRLLKLMENVEGRQVETRANVEIITSDGMCKGMSTKDRCFHGMSGAPLVTSGRCVGILYGKHPEAQENYGFVPLKPLEGWIAENALRLSNQTVST